MNATVFFSLLSCLMISFGMYYGFMIKYRLVRIPLTITYGLLLTGEVLDIAANINGSVRYILIEILEFFVIIGFFVTTYYSWDWLKKKF